MDYPKDSLAEAKATRSNLKAGVMPVLILCDNSGSMQEYTDTVNKCFEDLIIALKEDTVHSHKIDLRIASFNIKYEEILPFTMVEHIDVSKLKKIEPVEWATYLGKALSKAVEELAQEKVMFKSSKIDYFQPTLIVISDGYPEKEVPSVTEDGIKAVQDKIENEHWNCIPIFVGHDYGSDTLSRIAVPDKNKNKGVIKFDSNDKKRDIIEAIKYAGKSSLAVAQQVGNPSYRPTPTSELAKMIRETETRRQALKKVPAQSQKKSFWDKLGF